MAMQLQTALAILRRKQVEQRTGLSRSTIYALLSKDQFPKPVNIGPRAVGWIESEINAWLNARIEQSRRAA